MLSSKKTPKHQKVGTKIEIKKRQKDIEATWTKKNDETHYGYKNHTKVDNKYKFIDTHTVTTASTHDSQALDTLLTEKDRGQVLHADSAYSGKEQNKTLDTYGVNGKVHKKGVKGKPLTEEQKANNNIKSKTRARVEHVFGFMEGRMNGLTVNSIGLQRASSIIGLINLTYNLFRYEQLVRLHGITMS